MMQAPPPPGARRRVPDVVQQLVHQHRADQRKRLEDVLRPVSYTHLTLPTKA